MQQIQIFSIPAFGNDEKLDEMNFVSFSLWN